MRQNSACPTHLCSFVAVIKLKSFPYVSYLKAVANKEEVREAVNQTGNKQAVECLRSYLVPSSANKKAKRCFGWRCKLAKEMKQIRRRQARGTRAATLSMQQEETQWHSQFADVREVDKRCFLGAHPDHLGGLHDKLPLLPGHHVRVLLAHDVEDSGQQLRTRCHMINSELLLSLHKSAHWAEVL